MTFSEWMAQNGYGQYNSASGRRELQKLYGITEPDSAKANMALWAKLKAGEQAPSEPVKREVVAPMATKVTPLTITAPQPKQIIIPELYLKLVLNREPLVYTGDRIGYQQVGVTPAVFVPNQNVYGGTVTLAKGGKVNYLDYTH